MQKNASLVVLIYHETHLQVIVQKETLLQLPFVLLNCFNSIFSSFGAGNCNSQLQMTKKSILWKKYIFQIELFACFYSNYTNISIFYPLEVVGRGSETRLQVGEIIFN